MSDVIAVRDPCDPHLIISDNAGPDMCNIDASNNDQPQIDHHQNWIQPRLTNRGKLPPRDNN